MSDCKSKNMNYSDIILFNQTIIQKKIHIKRY